MKKEEIKPERCQIKKNEINKDKQFLGGCYFKKKTVDGRRYSGPAQEPQLIQALH